MKTRFIYNLAAIVMLASLFASCKKDEPTIDKIEAEINDYSVTFSAVVTNATSYLWDFGDGTTSTEAAPVHEYEMSGTYTVTLTVTGDGGSVTSTKEVIIQPSFTEMLTGGPDATGGKTWMFSRGYTEGVNGGGIVDNNMWVMLPTAENVLELIGLGGEYENEFTFFHDGVYEIGENNNTALAAGIYGMTSTTIVSQGNEHNDLGLVSSLYTPPASATWTLHEGNLVVNAITNPLADEVPPAISERTISGKKWISLSEDAYFGILDFPTTRQFVVKELTEDKMEVALFVCAYWADWQNSGNVPTFFFHLSFVPKP
jgi:PKD repeat protein